MSNKTTYNKDLSLRPGSIKLFRKTLKRYLRHIPDAPPHGPVPPVRLIAFYLPQFHQIPENDGWWGKGFTEWTNVKKATPLFKHHLQPKVPSEMGYYDLLDRRVRETQADLAKNAGIEGFCYWHYWFGNGKRLLEKPFQEVLESGHPGFPFCLAWANESWTGIWHGSEDTILIKQEYPGKEDYVDHFHALENAFRDPRYIRIRDRLLFVVYKPWEIPDPAEFIKCWQQLSRENRLPGFYFIGISDTPLPREFGFEGVMPGQPGIPERTIFPTFAEILFHRIFHIHLRRYFRVMNPAGPEVYPYRSYVRHSLNETLTGDEFPVVLPNWDNTPRVGRRGIVLDQSTPGLFAIHVKKAIHLIMNRPDDERIIFIKSWNEWAEGNYLEPDRQWGGQYLQAIKDVLSETEFVK